MKMESGLQQLSVQNFRSHRERVLKLAPLTVIIGPNGAGKTNLLEALWMIATTRSFRSHRDLSIIHWEADFASARLDDWELILLREPQLSKTVKIRGVIQRPIDYLGHVRAVLFTPDSFRILTDGPDERRRFLDTILAQRDGQTARTLLAYRQTVRQRNALLRQIGRGRSGRNELEVWNTQLAQLGVTIQTARKALLVELHDPLRTHHTAIGGARAGQVELHYDMSGPASLDAFLLELAGLEDREIAVGQTLIGPHRDNFSVNLNGHSAIEHASRGELRRILLALKWAEVTLLRQASVPLLLLLDDVFSELDQEHRQALLQMASDAQTVITTTDRAFLPAGIQSEAAFVELEPVETTR